MKAPQALRPTPAEARSAIDALDLDAMAALCRRNFDWSDQDVKDAQYWYREFLWLCYQYADQPIGALSKRADLLWHQHIIDTVRYRQDCDRIFGTYLNHVPFYGASRDAASEEEVNVLEQTRALYRQAYGPDLPVDMDFTSFAKLQPPGPEDEPSEREDEPPAPKPST